MKFLVRGLSWGALGVFAISTSGIACAVVFGFDELADHVDAGVIDAQDDTPIEDAGPGDAPVRERCIPLPRAPDAAGAGGPLYTFALSSLRLTQAEDPPRGIDLDCTITTTPETSSCALDQDVSKFPSAIRDQGDGFDNAGIAPLSLLESLQPKVFPLKELDTRVRAGDVGINFAVLDVVDLTNDDNVTIDAFPTNGLANGQENPCVPPLPYDAGRELKESDSWCFDKRFLAGDTLTSLLHSDVAWIRDGQLIGRFPHLAIPVIGKETREVLYIHLQNAWLTARIDPTTGGLTRGVIAGRWPTAEIGRQVVAASQQADAACATTPVGSGQFGVVCSYRDILADEAVDLTRTCDSISVSASFEAYRVSGRGEPSDVVTIEARCGDAGVHYDCTDAAP